MICYGRMFDDADVGHFTFTESEKVAVWFIMQ